MVKKDLQLKTKRLQISPMTDQGMEQLIEKTTDEELKRAYQEMLEGCRKLPKQREWFAAWEICLKETGERIGDACFKGPAKNYSVEIGYGIGKEYQGNGYMTEAVKALTDWAFLQENVYFVEAETAPDNIPSKRVLEKLGFEPDGSGEEGSRFVLEKAETSWGPIYMLFGLSIGLSLGSSSGNMGIGMCLGMAVGLCIGSALDGSFKKKRKQIREERETGKAK